MELVAGYDEAVADWAGRQLGVKFVAPYVAFGIIDNSGKAVGAAVFNNHFERGNIEWSHVGPGSITRSVVRQLAQYAFVHCEASRVTAKTMRRNVKVRKLLPKAGFTFEGTQKRFFGPDAGDDALVYVLFREQAQRWLGHTT